MTFDALVLCGGAGRRLGGADKAAVVVGERSLLDRALDAVGAARTTIAVGPTRATARKVTWTIEDPPGGGPVAAIEAGLGLVTAETVVVLGVDFPFVAPVHVARLLAALDGDGARPLGASTREGAIYVDATGRHQFLVGAYRSVALRAALVGRAAHGMAVKDLVGGIDLVELDDPRATQDVDTWADAHAAQAAID
jgi:molybdopterin-guanine dinucleotide biosynthesis protein A